jgi:F0F1-type ATP synthase delta subunit
VTGVKEVLSTENHKAPIREESIEGRYAGVLFSAASRQGNLYKVYEDMAYILSIHKNVSKVTPE